MSVSCVVVTEAEGRELYCKATGRVPAPPTFHLNWMANALMAAENERRCLGWGASDRLTGTWCIWPQMTMDPPAYSVDFLAEGVRQMPLFQGKIHAHMEYFAKSMEI